MQPITLATTVAAGIALAAASAWAGPATDQVKTAVDRVIEVVQDPELRKPQNAERRRTRIREVARALFDFEEMARRSLARHWAPRTPEQQRRFTELFADLLERSYIAKIEAYGGEQVVYLPEKAEGDTVTLRSRVVSPRGTEIPLEYRLQRDGDRWEVFDLVIEHVSLVANYRTQFNRVIAQSSYEELIRRMEQKQLEVNEEQRTRPGGARTP
jgi:phospholipid transport system substrate-binding protein